MSYAVNKRYYDLPGTPEYYGRDTTLWKAEEAILAGLRTEIRNKPILEIGVGAGRATPYLRELSSDYLGVDHSEKMIELCRERNRDARLFVADARNMSMFEEGMFAAVFWCFNGMDEADAEDRPVMLSEISRVLKGNGLFIFSSHNLDWNLIPAYSLKSVLTSFKPLTALRKNATALGTYASNLATRIRRRLTGKGGAVVHEYVRSLGMVLPTYYIGKEEQFRQLLRAGFWNIKAYGMDGLEIEQEKSKVDPWVYYVARKAAK